VGELAVLDGGAGKTPTNSSPELISRLFDHLVDTQAVGFGTSACPDGMDPVLVVAVRALCTGDTDSERPPAR
jgi:hypothetical protein